MIAILVIAGVAGLIWTVVLFRWGDLVGGCLAVLLTGSIFGHAFFHISVVTADRLLLAGLAVVYVGYRRLGWADPKPIAKADIAFFLFLFVLTLSTFTHNWQLHGAQPLATLLFFFLLPAALYWIGRQAKLTEQAVRTIFTSLAVFGVYLAATAIAEKLNAWTFVFPKYIASPAYEEFYGRARGPFLNPIGCGLFLSVGLFAAVQWWPRVQQVGRTLVVMVSALILIGVYCTLTRSVWLGAAAGLFAIVWLAISARWRMSLLITLLLAASSVLAWKWHDLNAFKRDKNVSVHDMSQSAGLRPVLATVAWKMFLDRPLFGCGFGQYKEFDRQYLQDPSSDLDLEKARPYVQHNVFLALLTQTGVLGLGLWLTVLGLWIRDAWSLWINHDVPTWARQHALLLMSVIAAYGINGLFHDVGIIVMVNMLLFFLAGVCQGLLPLAKTLPRAAGATCIATSRVTSMSGA